MELNHKLLRQFEQEAANTRKMMERVPAEHFDWRPHPKSMTLRQLAAHVAELPRIFIALALQTEEVDFAKQKPAPFTGSTQQELMQLFEDSYQSAVKALNDTNIVEIAKTWTMRAGDKVLISLPRQVVIRTMAMNHLIHHRGQLSVYLRLLDVPVPGMYGPSADEGFGG
ncbi:DinB family protein [Rufibacter quisquiliarum]|uniref:Putative damage-inducible protein DinB n=2 Tax=Rufibacter TaxID=1379908 RepID=A0A839GUM7_9BACT|nr:DinB family protein [Rufibacter quisquiliarum]MBA9079185.1 putative damage-inducible protein DinB [Rufibacter quisquiliarum]